MVLTTVWKAIFLKIIMRIITVIQYKTLMNFSVQLMRSATIWGWDSLYGIPEECRVFVLGKDLDDHIEVKNHYAVSDNQVYYLDVIENTWNILGSG